MIKKSINRLKEYTAYIAGHLEFAVLQLRSKDTFMTIDKNDKLLKS